MSRRYYRSRHGAMDADTFKRNSHCGLRYKENAHPAEFPLADPFGISPTDAEVKWECETAKLEPHVRQTRRHICHVSMSTSELAIAVTPQHEQ